MNNLNQEENPQMGQQNQNPQMDIVESNAGLLKDDRSLLKYLLLSIVTFGIYPLLCLCQMSNDINTIASRYDGKKTMNFFLACLLTVFTLGIYLFIWFHNYSKRVSDECERRGINTNFGTSTFWLWSVLGSLVYVGPLVYFYKLFNVTNELARNYNMNGQ